MNETDTAKIGIAITRAPPRYHAVGVICILILILALIALLGAGGWLLWILASGILGAECVTVVVIGLVAGAAGFSWQTNSGFVGSLIMVGFGGFTVLTAALFGVAGYALIFGG